MVINEVIKGVKTTGKRLIIEASRSISTSPKEYNLKSVYSQTSTLGLVYSWKIKIPVGEMRRKLKESVQE